MGKEWLPENLMEDSVGYTYHLNYEDDEVPRPYPLVAYEYSEGMEEPTVQCLIKTDSPEIHGFLVQPCDIEAVSDEELGALIRRAYDSTYHLACYNFLRSFCADPWRRGGAAIIGAHAGRGALVSQARFQEVHGLDYQTAARLALEYDEWRILFDRLKPYWECENPEGGYIYCLHDQQGHYKLGRTRQLNTRIKQLGTQPPFEIVLEFAFKVLHMRAYEAHLHKEFQHKRMRGEWFKLDEEDLKHIKRFAWLPE